MNPLNIAILTILVCYAYGCTSRNELKEKVAEKNSVAHKQVEEEVELSKEDALIAAYAKIKEKNCRSRYPH